MGLEAAQRTTSKARVDAAARAMEDGREQAITALEGASNRGSSIG
jgi:hypothetical protein